MPKTFWQLCRRRRANLEMTINMRKRKIAVSRTSTSRQDQVQSNVKAKSCFTKVCSIMSRHMLKTVHFGCWSTSLLSPNEAAYPDPKTLFANIIICGEAPPPSVVEEAKSEAPSSPGAVEVPCTSKPDMRSSNTYESAAELH